VQVGIHSTGDCQSISQSTDVSAYIEWIQSTGANPQLR
jgi:hypothetical protein